MEIHGKLCSESEAMGEVCKYLLVGWATGLPLANGTLSADPELRAEHRFIQRQAITAEMCVFVDEVGVVRYRLAASAPATGHPGCMKRCCNVIMCAGRCRTGQCMLLVL